MVDSTSKPTYLIVGGTTKAGTTSVFSYLSDHPQLCGSSLKETRYFLDPAYPLPIPRSYLEEGRDGYEQYFQSCSEDRIRVEATPDYLYSKPTPEALHQFLPSVRCVFLLRDPIDRLGSWYRFARQNGQVARSLSFPEYVRRQLEEASTPPMQPWRALEQGRYARYLQRFIEVLGEDRVMIAFFEDFTTDPEQTLRAIVEFAGTDADFYADYEFTVMNETKQVKSPSVHAVYRWLLRTIRYRVHRWPRIHRAFRRLRSWVDPLYYAVASDDDDLPVDVSAVLRDRLRRYYARDLADLVELTGRQPPWSLAETVSTK